MVKAKEIERLRNNKVLNLIENEKNIFSEEILTD
jgi:hypothetical protein